MTWFLLALLLLGPAVGGQPRRPAQPARPPAPAAPAPASQAWPIESLSVDGNRNYPQSAILAVAGLKLGQPATPEAFEAARERLLATGLFESVGYRYEPAPGGKGYRSVIEVAEVEPVYSFRFEDLPLPADGLRVALEAADPLFGARLPATAAVLDRYSRLLQSRLAESGFRDRVVGRLVSERQDEVVIVFRPATPPPSIVYVRFTGAEAVEAAVLQNAMAGVAVGVPYSEQRVRELLDTAIRPRYEAKGRMRVSFPEISAAEAPDAKGVVVTVRVAEGEVYELGEVGAQSYPLPPAEIVKAAGLKSGERADFDAVGEGRERILRLLRKNGHMKGAVKIDRTIDDAARKVNVIYQVEAGPRFTFGALKVEGLDILTEPAIRKLWGLKPGQPFDADYPEFFLNRIREDGVFDNLGRTRSSIQVNEAGQTVNVTLYFGEAARKSLLPGV